VGASRQNFTIFKMQLHPHPGSIPVGHDHDHEPA